MAKQRKGPEDRDKIKKIIRKLVTYKFVVKVSEKITELRKTIIKMGSVAEDEKEKELQL